MLIAAPIWLLALIPWAVLATWMLWGRREQVAVPFVALWRDGEARPTSSRAVRAPSLPIILLLLTILLAILAASSPIVSRADAQSLTILIDRGVTMSARDGIGYRYHRAADLLAPHLRGPVRLLAVPAWEEREVNAAVLTIAIPAMPPTAVDTSADIAQAARRLLASSEGAVVVFTDHPIEFVDPRLIVVPPPAAKSNMGITLLAAREKPAAQVMVRIDAEGPTKVGVVINSDGARVERSVDAPGPLFIDMPRLGKTIDVTLSPGDALEADNEAWLVREAGWPRIEPIATLSAEFSRMVQTYGKLRPPRADARVVSVVDAAGASAAEAVVLAPASNPVSGAVDVVDHLVAAGVAWRDVLADARIGGAVPEGFAPVIYVGANVAVAVRESPRQVLVAIDSESLPRRADYVVFWTNVFDWLGQGGDAFVAHPIGLLGDEWRRVTDGPPQTEPGLWPGIYERTDGTLRAVSAGPHAKPTTAPTTNDWQQRLARLPATSAGGHALSPYLLLAALACAFAAAALWPARRTAQT